MDPSGPLVCWPIAARPPASGGGILGCEAAGIRAHVLLCLLRAEAVAGAGCWVPRRPSGGRPGGSRRKRVVLVEESPVFRVDCVRAERIKEKQITN